jgi:hypothetical protein
VLDELADVRISEWTNERVTTQCLRYGVGVEGAPVGAAARLAVDRWRSRRLSADRRIGMTLIVVAGLVALLGGLWFGEGWAAVAVAGWIVTTAVLAGWFYARVSRRAGQHAGKRS